MTSVLQPSRAVNPFDAIVDPSAALEAHARLATALGERCVRWSPLDKAALQPQLDESDSGLPAADVESGELPDSGRRLWP